MLDPGAPSSTIRLHFARFAARDRVLPGRYPVGTSARRARAAAGRRRLRLPDAPAVPLGPPRRLSLLRHAPRAGARRGRGVARGRERRDGASGRRGAGEPRAPADDRGEARRRGARLRHAHPPDDRARGAQRERRVPARRRRGRRGARGAGRDDGIVREEGRGPALFFAPEFVNAADLVLLRARHAQPRAPRRRGRALRQHPAQPGRLRAAARRAAGPAQAQASTSSPLAGRRLRARPQGVRRPALRPRLRVLPHRRPAPRLDPRRRVREPGAFIRAGSKARVTSQENRRARGHGQPRRADLRRGDAHAEGAARGRQPGRRAQAGDVRGRRVRRRAARRPWPSPRRRSSTRVSARPCSSIAATGYFEPRGVETGWRARRPGGDHARG